jgi:long-chain acyl-CoA synthetase
MPRVVGLLQRAVQIYPHRAATRHEGRVLSWTDFAGRVARMAGALLRLGLQPGDRVAIAARDSDRFAEAVFAVMWAGGVLQPLNLRLAQPEIADQLTDAGTSLLIADQAGLDAMGATARQLPLLYLDDGDGPAGAVHYEQAMSGAAAEHASLRAGDDLAMLLFTGGTTGRAKGVMLSHRNIVSSVLMGLAVQQPSSDDVSLLGLPMFHVAGLLYLLRGTAACACICFLPRFDAGTWLELASRERVTRAVLAPVMLRAVLEHPSFASTDLSALRAVTYGASPMPEPILRRAIAQLPKVGFYQAYGQTESTSGCVFLTPEWHVVEGPRAERLQAAGRVVPGMELVILGPDGSKLRSDAVGEVCLRGDMVMRGYWSRPEETAKALADGWLHTGDAGWLDDDGLLFIVDRLKDMIVSGGENVYSAEVETALMSHPAVLECAVFGIPDVQWGEAVHAVIRLRDGEQTDAEALRAHCATQIARYKCPRSITLDTTPLPRSAIGKVLKTELRRSYWAGQTRNVH